MESSTVHKPVLLAEVLEYMRAEQGGNFLDCTFGGGGHTEALLQAHQATQVVACDRDPRALERGMPLSRKYSGRLELRELRFSEISEAFPSTKFDAVLADLGMSTDHLHAGTGFSFTDDALDMRMDSRTELTADMVVNEYSEGRLRSIFKKGGVSEQYARRFARGIVKSRPFRTARSLADFIESLVPIYERKQSHPATVVFQALRIEVNQEFAEIEKLLSCLPDLLNSGGRFICISFHSLEDKIVTRNLRALSRSDAPALLDPTGAMKHEQASGRLLTPSAVVASEDEKKNLPSSRSARLRAFEFF